MRLAMPACCSGNIAAVRLAEIAVAGKLAAIVVLNSATDFVASNDQFMHYVNCVAAAIAANCPAALAAACATCKRDGQTIAVRAIA